MEIFSQSSLPDIPDLIRVTVDHSDDGVLVQWEPSNDNDILYYHMYKMNADLAFVKIFSFDNTTYEFKHMTSGLKNLAYSVTAEDSSGNESLFGANLHRAVSLTPEFDPCTPANIINWNAYMGWEGEISGYRIYGAPAGNSFSLLSFEPATTLSYKDADITPGTPYYYYIETININGIISHSAIDSVLSVYPDSPEYIVVDYVSVIDENSAALQFTADITGSVNNFRVMKRSDPATPYIEVTTLWDMNQSTQSIQDVFPTSTESYQYIVQSLYQEPSCEIPLIISESNTGNSILLENEIEDQIVTLNWSSYETYDSGLSGYIIQRRSGNGDFFDIQTVGPGTTQWSEAIQSVTDGFQPGKLQYKVLAISNQNGQNATGISISNITTVDVISNLQIPSAFTPGSNDMNFEFKPLMDFAPQDYLMFILDRGGRKMFETTDPGQGWDGRFNNGEFVNEGVYVYYIQMTDYTGLFKSFTGNVTVLYP